VQKKSLFLLAGVATVAALAGCIAPGSPSPSSEQNGGVPAVVRPRVRRPTDATDDAPLPERPSLLDYLTYAALHNPGLEAAFDRWKAALEQVPQVKALPDPRLTYRYFIREVETRVGPQEQGFALAQTFPWFGKLKLRGDAAWEASEAARMRYETTKLRLFYRVSEAFYEYYFLGRSIAVVREQRDFMKYLEAVLRVRYKAAAAAHANVIRAQVELGKLDDRLRALVALREPVIAGLNAALNRPVEADLPWPDSIDEQGLAATDEEIIAWLEVANPELRELEHEVARQDYGVRLARRDYYPDVTLGLDYVDTGPAVMAAPDSSKDPVVAMISVNLPIWRQKLEAGVRQAEARKRAVAGARAERLNSLTSAVKMVLYRFRDAERKIDLYRDTLLPKGRQSLIASEAAFRAGTASFLDVVDAVRVLLEFELSYERALADLAQRLAELEMLVGKEFRRPADGLQDEQGGPAGVEEEQTP